MRKSTILARLRAGQPARVSSLGHVIPSFVAYGASVGLDGIWLDLEHRPMDVSAVQMMLAFSHLYDIDIFVRPPTREKAALYRYLEDGAAGLMIPHVSTPEEAEDLVSKVKFPPVGDRGLAPSNLQANYGVDTQDGRQVLVDHALRETFLFVQLETPLAVANIEAIAAVPGLDGLYLGPSDLMLRMQHEAEENRLTYEQVMDRMAAACKRHNKYWGAWPRKIEDLRYQHGLGAHLYEWGVDNTYILDGLRQSYQDLEAIFAGS